MHAHIYHMLFLRVVRNGLLCLIIVTYCFEIYCWIQRPLHSSVLTFFVAGLDSGDGCAMSSAQSKNGRPSL